MVEQVDNLAERFDIGIKSINDSNLQKINFKPMTF